jgi:two-component system, cell cycle response regulator DivK
VLAAEAPDRIRYRMSEEVGISTLRDEGLVADHDEHDRRRVRLLLVDDDDSLQNIYRIVLERAGHEVRFVEDARLVLETARAFRPNIVLMDLDAPHLDARALARSLYDDTRTAHAVLVAVSADDEMLQRVDLEEAGFRAYLRKPVRLRTLVQAVDVCLGAMDAPGVWIDLAASGVPGLGDRINWRPM